MDNKAICTAPWSLSAEPFCLPSGLSFPLYVHSKYFKKTVYHCQCTSQLCPADWTIMIKLNVGAYYPVSWQDISTQFYRLYHWYKQPGKPTRNAFNRLLSCICFRSSPHCSFLIHILFAPSFPFSCMLLCGISGRYRTSFKCSSTICQGILSTSVWIPPAHLQDLI